MNGPPTTPNRPWTLADDDWFASATQGLPVIELERDTHIDPQGFRLFIDGAVTLGMVADDSYARVSLTQDTVVIPNGHRVVVSTILLAK